MPPPDLAAGAVTLRFERIVPAEPEKGLVPFYHFRILVKDTDVGHINLRIGDTEHVRLYAGHIGYQVLEPFRGHNYALQACCALAPFVRSLYPSVIITANPENYASLRTIEALRTTFLDEVVVPDHDPHFASGNRIKRRYRWTL